MKKLTSFVLTMASPLNIWVEEGEAKAIANESARALGDPYADA